MAAQEIHITSNGNFTIVGNPGLNGFYNVQIVDDLGGGTITPQVRVRPKDADGNEETYVNMIDPSTGTAYTFTAAGSFEMRLNGQVQINMAGASSPDCYVLFKEIKTEKI